MRSTLRTSHSTRPAQFGSRSAFTLIELIVVIMIIAILSSLLMVGVQSAVGRAREAAVGVDVKNLEQGIKEFQSKFSVSEPPPSALILFEDADDWADFTAGMNTQQNVALIRRLWPSFLKSNGKPDINNDGMVNGSDNIDINGNGTIDTTPIRLNGAECLVFFLGGIMEIDGSNYIPRGFSTNPLNPFYRPAMPTDSWGTRIGPFTEFRPSRLVDDPFGGTDGMPVYRDAFPNSITPYQYFSSYGGRGYRLSGFDGVSSTTAEQLDDEVLWIDATTPTLRSVYLQKDNNYSMGGTAAITGAAWNPKGFQIISAGADGQWGVGGLYKEAGIPTDGTGAYRQYSARSPELDNITNFKGGRLN